MAKGLKAYGRLPFHDELQHSLPLPLAQLYLRAYNAKEASLLHNTAYYLWEASLKLLGSVAIVEYAKQPVQEPSIVSQIQALSRPSIGHWWMLIRSIVPVLANNGVFGFDEIDGLLFGGVRHDLERVEAMNRSLRKVLAMTSGTNSGVRLSDLFDNLVVYRNKVIGHGAHGLRPREYYQQIGERLYSGMGQLLKTLDVLGGRVMVYIADVRSLHTGDWLVDRYQLLGQKQKRLESFVVSAEYRNRLPSAQHVYLQLASTDASHLLDSGQLPELSSLHPLTIFDFDKENMSFINSRSGKRRVEYLCYFTGETSTKEELSGEFQDLLARSLRIPLESADVDEWADQGLDDGDSPEVEEEPNTENRIIGDFEILREIGRGGMGVVYRARQLSLNRQVALKCLLRVDDDKAEARFRREIRALGRVEHPNLVKVFTSGFEDNRLHYAMELIDGTDLGRLFNSIRTHTPHASEVTLKTWEKAFSTVVEDQIVETQPIEDEVDKEDSSESEPLDGMERPSEPVPVRKKLESVPRDYVRRVVDQMRQVAEAAHALHEVAVLHRDIKPDNIMVTLEGSRAVLMDLGLAQLADEVQGVTKSRTFVGTIRYSSPEQILSVGTLDRRTDIYSIGATLWELLTLEPMFGCTEETPLPEAMRRVQVEEPDSLRKWNNSVPKDLEAIVLKCLEKNASRRYETARDVARDLERFLNGEPVRARSISTPERTYRSIKRHPIRTLSALALLLTALFGGYGFVYATFAEQQKALFEDALQTVNFVFGEVTRDELRSNDDLHDAREKLLDYFERYSKEHSDDLEVLPAVASIHLKIADVSKDNAEQRGEAVRHLDEAIKLFERLNRESPGITEYLDKMAIAKTKMADMLRGERKYDEGKLEIKDAIRTLEELCQREPNNPNFRWHLGDAYHESAKLHDESATSTEDIRYARDLFLDGKENRRWADAGITSETRRSFEKELARSYGYLGDIELRLDEKNIVKAMQWYDEALRIRKKLVEEKWSDSDARFELSRSYGNSSRLSAKSGKDLAKAIQEESDSFDLLRSLIKERPNNVAYRLDFFWGGNSLAELYLDCNDHDNAQKVLDEMQDNLGKRGLLEDPAIVSAMLRMKTNRTKLAAATNNSEARTSELAEAMRHYKWLEEKNINLSDDDLYNLALTAALSHPPAADKVIGTLKTAIEEKGFRDFARLRRDVGFNSIRDRKDFKDFIAKLPNAAKAAVSGE